MFSDIGFWELVIIGIISLVVLGPERLPTAIRSVRGWISSVKTFSSNVQSEIKEELRIHELHENLKKAESRNMEDLSPELAESVKSLKEAADMVTRPFSHDDDDYHNYHQEDEHSILPDDKKLTAKPDNVKKDSSFNDKQ